MIIDINYIYYKYIIITYILYIYKNIYIYQLFQMTILRFASSRQSLLVDFCGVRVKRVSGMFQCWKISQKYIFLFYYQLENSIFRGLM